MVAISQISNITAVAAIISGGLYNILDSTGRCVELTASEQNDYVPIVSSACNGNLTQQWRFTASSINYAISNLVVPTSFLSYSSAEAGTVPSTLSQQAMAHTQPVFWELLVIDNEHLGLIPNSNFAVGLTAWVASTQSPQGPTPLTIEPLFFNENGQASNTLQGFMIVGPL